MSLFGTLPGVAKNIFFFCKKCDCERYQKVITHLDAFRAKLECEVCRTKNTYSTGSSLKKTGGAVKKKALSKKALATKATKDQGLWLTLKEKASLDNKQPYSMKTKYSAKAVIDHPKFGLGFVMTVTETSAQVQFEDGEKALVHNRA